METKKCSKCGEKKDRSEFTISKVEKDGLCIYCRECNRKKHKEWRDKNIEHLKAYTKQRCIDKKDKIKEYSKTTYKRHKQKLNEYGAKWRKENKQKQKEICAKWYQLNKSKCLDKVKNSPILSLLKNIRNNINISLKKRGYSKKSKTYTYLQCSYEEFIIHLGPKPNGDYHLDHICPCAQAKNEKELIKLQHYTNFRWMQAEDNIAKSSNWTPEGEEMCRKLLNRNWIFN